MPAASHLPTTPDPLRGSPSKEGTAQGLGDLLGLLRVSTGLIGIARCVRAAWSVAGSSTSVPHARIDGLAVDGGAVVGLVADAQLP